MTSLSGLAALGAALSVMALFAGTGRTEPIRIGYRAVPLESTRAGEAKVGRLRYRGGLALRSDDPRFGGLSGLAIDGRGRAFMAVTDGGYWIGADLSYDSDGRLAGIANGRIRPLLGPGGRRYPRKRLHDAESLAVAGKSMLVAFEHWHRIWAYPHPRERRDWNARPRALMRPPGLRRAPANEGAEALTVLADGRLFLLTEGQRLRGGGVRGWVGRPGSWRQLRYRPAPGFRPTAAATLPDGDVVVVERRASMLGGLTARIVQVSRAALARDGDVRGSELAMLAPPLTVDNMEGVAVRRDRSGRVLIYLVSDDNFSMLQRTLLLMFELEN